MVSISPCPRPRRLPWAALVLTAAAGCDGARAGSDPPGLLTAAGADERPIAAARAAADVDELARALSLPHRRVGALLGPHRFAGASHLRVSEGGAEVEALDDTTAIELADHGEFHARLDNSDDYGRDVYYVGGVMYLRPRYGRFNRRPPAEEEEPERVRDEVYGALGATFELVAAGAAVADGGAGSRGGRPVRKVTLSRAASQRPRPAESSPGRAWRDGAVVEALAGEVELDEATGVPLAAKLTATVSFSREGRSFSMTLSVDHAIDGIGEHPTVTAPAPESTVVAPARSREAEERELLLRGIAPPASRAPTPDNPTGGAAAQPEPQ